MNNWEEFVEEMQEEMEVPDEVWNRYEYALETLPKRATGKKDKRKVGKVWKAAAGIVAASLAVVVGLCFANPAFAQNIPGVGTIFEKIQSTVEYSGDYTTKDYTAKDSEEKTLAGASDQGIQITPSEVYCDGQSVYITVNIESEKGGFDGMSDEYTERFLDENGEANKANVISTLGSFQLKSDGKNEELDSDEFQGEVINDKEFVGLYKVDLKDIVTKEDVLKLHFDSLTYSYAIGDEYTNIAGDWNLTIPFTADMQNSKVYEVKEENDKGYGIDKVFVSPYQVVVYTKHPEQKPSMEYTKENYEKKKEAGEKVPDTYEEFANVVMPGEHGVCIFNQDNEALEYSTESATGQLFFARKGLDIQKLQIFMSTDEKGIYGIDMIKTIDVKEAEKKASLKAVVTVD